MCSNLHGDPSRWALLQQVNSESIRRAVDWLWRISKLSLQQKWIDDTVWPIKTNTSNIELNNVNRHLIVSFSILRPCGIHQKWIQSIFKCKLTRSAQELNKGTMILVLSRCLKCAKGWETSSAPIGCSEKRCRRMIMMLPASLKKLLVVGKTASLFFFVPLPPNRPFLFLTVKSIKELMLYLNLKLTKVVKKTFKKRGWGIF